MSIPSVGGTSPHVNFLRLPEEIVNTVVSLLDISSTESLGATSKDLRRIALLRVRNDSFRKLEHLIHELSSRLTLESEKSKKEKLNEIEAEIIANKEKPFVDFSSLKDFLFHRREGVFRILDTISKRRLIEFKNEPLLESVCEILIKHRQYFQALELVFILSNKEKRGNFLEKILCGYDSFLVAIDMVNRFRDLLQQENWMGEISQALIKRMGVIEANRLVIEIEGHLREFRNNLLQDVLFENISKALLEKGDQAAAVEVALKISNKFRQGNTIEYICKSLLKNEEVDRVEGLIHAITNEKTRDLISNDLCVAFVKQKKFDRAVDAARRIQDRKEMGNALLSICKALVHEREFRRVQELIESIPDDHQKEEALNGLCWGLIQEKQFDLATEIVVTIATPYKKDELLFSICRGIVEAGDPDRAIQWALQIVDQFNRETSITNICESLIARKEFDKAKQLSEHIRNSYFLDTLKISIANGFLSEGALDKAEITALEISGDFLRQNIFQFIADSYASRGDFERAIEVVDRITEEGLSSLSRLSVCNMLIQAGNLDLAEEVCFKGPKTPIRSLIVSDLRRAFMEKGDFPRALEVLKRK